MSMTLGHAQNLAMGMKGAMALFAQFAGRGDEAVSVAAPYLADVTTKLGLLKGAHATIHGGGVNRAGFALTSVLELGRTVGSGHMPAASAIRGATAHVDLLANQIARLR